MTFGGSLLVGKRRGQRPLQNLRPIHLVLKADNANLLLRNRRVVRSVVIKFCRKFYVGLYDSGVHADHVHLTITIPDRESYVRWVRAVASVLVQRIPGLKWRLRPFTRVAHWGRQFYRLRNYIKRNEREGKFLLEGFERVEAWLNEFKSTVLARAPVHRQNNLPHLRNIYAQKLSTHSQH